MKISLSLATIPAVWKKLLAMLKRHPVILVPFVLIALIDLVVLAILFLAPRPPLSTVLAPVIRAFWGERFLHYPTNFFLLPQLFNHARNILSFLSGVTLTGIAAALIFQAYQGEKAQWWFSVKKSVRWYFRLLIVWACTFATIFGAVKLLGSFAGVIGSYKLMLGLEFLVSVLIQTAFVFAIPAIIIENRKVLISLKRSFALVKDYPVASFVLVLIPSLLFLPITYVQAKLPVLMERTMPEMMLYFLSARVGVLGVIDFLVTSSAVVLLLMHKETESGEATV